MVFLKKKKSQLHIYIGGSDLLVLNQERDLEVMVDRLKKNFNLAAVKSNTMLQVIRKGKGIQ